MKYTIYVIRYNEYSKSSKGHSANCFSMSFLLIFVTSDDSLQAVLFKGTS